jgi:uncharacterized protein
MKLIVNYIRKDTWSPYVAGILLGVIGLLAVLLANALLGASGAFESFVGWVGKNLNLSIFNNSYWGTGIGRVLPIMRPEITWSVILLVGTILGGTIGALTSHTFKFRWNDDAQWKRIFGPQPWKRFVIGFFGAALLEYAAGIAGGCTSGLAISGGMTFTPAAFLFIGGMFVSGIITLLIVYGRRY